MGLLILIYASWGSSFSFHLERGLLGGSLLLGLGWADDMCAEEEEDEREGASISSADGSERRVLV